MGAQIETPLSDTERVSTSVEVQCKGCGRRARREPPETEARCIVCTAGVRETGRFMSADGTGDSARRQRSVADEGMRTYRVLLPTSASITL